MLRNLVTQVKKLHEARSDSMRSKGAAAKARQIRLRLGAPSSRSDLETVLSILITSSFDSESHLYFELRVSCFSRESIARLFFHYILIPLKLKSDILEEHRLAFVTVRPTKVKKERRDTAREKRPPRHSADT